MAPNDEMHLVAVYDTAQHARAAAAALESAGVDSSTVRIDDRLDRIDAVRAEMRSETAVHSVAGPGNVGPWTKQMAEGMTIGTIVGGAIGLLVALPFAAIPFGVAWWARLVIVAIVGAVIGGTVGWIIGGGFAAKRPDEPLAAEVGVTLTVPASNRARTTLITTDPERLDVVRSDGRPVVVVTERERGINDVVHEIGRHMGEEPRQG